jgi:hypothetical protein
MEIVTLLSFLSRSYLRDLVWIRGINEAGGLKTRPYGLNGCLNCFS